MPHVHRRGGYTDRHDHLPDHRLTAHAGDFQALTTETTLTLTGSATGGVGPYTYLWEVFEGTATIADANSAVTTASLTGSGSFSFRLTVYDAHNSVAHAAQQCTRAAGQDVFGAAAITLGAVVLSSAATLDLTAALSATLGAVTLDSAANSLNTGALVRALDPLTSSAAATLDINAAVAKTLGALTLSATGTVDVAGALSKTLGSLSLTSTSTSGGAAPDYWTDWDVANAEQVVYLSSLHGNDSNSGLSEAAPKLTWAAAYALIRTGHADYLLVERGSSFTISSALSWAKSGVDASNPIVVAAYGTGARPVFKGVNGLGVDSNATISHVWFMNMDFYAVSRDPATPGYTTVGGEGLHWRSGTTNWLFEDCVWRFFTVTSIQNSFSRGITGLRFRRCQILDNYVTGGAHAEGIYMDGIGGCIYDECLFDNNGWNATVPGADKTVFNHNLYVDNGCSQTGIEVTNCVFLRASSHGVQLRPGGKLNGNHCEYNANELLFGGGDAPNAGGVYGECTGNVVLHGTDIPGISQGQRGISLQNIKTTAASLLCSNNIVANALNSSANESIDLGVTGVSYSGNTIYNWPVGTSLGGSHLDTTRDLAKYAGTLGFTATIAGAAAQLRLQRRDAWNENLTTQNIIAYVQAGFAPP